MSTFFSLFQNECEQAWNARCPDDAEFVEFTPELQQITLDAHNKLRNQIAMGETPRYPPAARMATMVYIFVDYSIFFFSLINNHKNRHLILHFI